MATTQQSYIGIGQVFIGKRSGGAMRFVGQVPEFKLDVTEEVKELKDHVIGGGGIADSVSFVSKVEASITFESLDVKNLALALRGANTDVASTTNTDIAYTAYPDSLLPLDGIGHTEVSVTVSPLVTWEAGEDYTVDQIIKPVIGTHFYKCKVAGTSDATEPTWETDGTDTTDGTVTWTDMGLMALTSDDYEINSAGIFIKDSSRIDVAGTPVTVTHTTSVGYQIQALIGAGEEYRIVFAGKNFARNGLPLKMDIFRAKISPSKELSLIGDDFAKLTMTATVMADDTKTGTDISVFCKIDMAA